MMDYETRMRVFAAYSPTDLARELAGEVIETLTNPKIDDYDEMTEHVFLAFSAVIAEAARHEGRTMMDLEARARKLAEDWIPKGDAGLIAFEGGVRAFVAFAESVIAEAARVEREACAKELDEMADRCEQRKTSGSTNGKRQNQWAMAISAGAASIRARTATQLAAADPVITPCVPGGGLETSLPSTEGKADSALNSTRAAAPQPLAITVQLLNRWPIGTLVHKIKGSSWRGKVVGYYSTNLTPDGYCVESDREPGSVQIYPRAALAHDGGKGEG